MTEPPGCSLDDDGGSMRVRVARVARLRVIEDQARVHLQHDSRSAQATRLRGDRLHESRADLYSRVMRLQSHLVRALGAMLLVSAVTNTLSAQVGDSLRGRLAQRIAATPGAVVGLYYKLLSSGELVTIDPDSSFHAASTMKVPVMIEFFRQVERGGLSAQQPVLVINQFASIADGSAFSVAAIDDSDSLMYTRVGERVPARELVDRMIVRSSNLATNTIIELVGAANANATAHALGARNIRVLRGVEDGKAFQKGMNNTT